ncbi:MAG: hypothetical protein A2252_04755 [Elusimicrobia bacterium RIFOXYA2_FULL_39_19]|nr:MAG: hypothetical protein A2252_04755 [Elusimicrobia bacterium RIFOXYA2_FULL_39_19]
MAIESINTQNILNAFFTGIILGNTKCLLLCLPIIIPFITVKQNNWKTCLKMTLTFSFSRVLGYIVLGILSVSAFKLALSLFNEQAVFIKLFLGLFIIISGISFLFSENKGFFAKNICKLFNKKINMVLLGFLTGVSPCAPLISFFIYVASVSSNIYEGSILAFSFGMGTVISILIPLSVFFGFLNVNFCNSKILITTVRIVGSIILIIFGLRIILNLLSAYPGP